MKIPPNIKKMKEIAFTRRQISLGRYVGYENLTEKEFMDAFNRTYNALENDYKIFMNNEFLKSNPLFWWTDIYSDSTYYRKKRRLAETFTTLFEACL